MKRALATSVAAFPFVLAFGLYATGTLERIDATLDLALARYRWGVSKPQPGPAQPLAAYAGWWQRDGVPHFGTEWVARVIVRTEGKRAWLHLWHVCGQRYCDQGEFEASVYGHSPENVHTLEVMRKKSKDVLWIVTLRPGSGNPNSLLILDERRARDPGRNPNDNQSSFTSLRRVK
jgi:hypothetical protein